MESCYDEGEKLLEVNKLADNIQRLEVGISEKGYYPTKEPVAWAAQQRIIDDNIKKLKSAIKDAEPYLKDTEKVRINNAMITMQTDVIAGTDEIMRTVQLPLTMAVLKCSKR